MARSVGPLEPLRTSLQAETASYRRASKLRHDGERRAATEMSACKSTTAKNEHRKLDMPIGRTMPSGRLRRAGNRWGACGHWKLNVPIGRTRQSGRLLCQAGDRWGTCDMEYLLESQCWNGEELGTTAPRLRMRLARRSHAFRWEHKAGGWAGGPAAVSGRGRVRIWEGWLRCSAVFGRACGKTCWGRVSLVS